MQPLQLIELVVPDRFAADGEVLSPESHVFVALMSVEEGPNKAVFLRGWPGLEADGPRDKPELMTPPGQE
jgi:hypothetical protein